VTAGDGWLGRSTDAANRLVAAGLQWAWSRATVAGAIGPEQRAARRFGRFGQGSFIAFPPTTIYNERYIWIGEGTRIGPHVSLSVGMAVGQVPVSDPVVVIGDRCLIGRGSGIVGHLSIEIGNDVFTGHHVYVTDQNHGYEDVTTPIGLQTMPERAVRVGDGSWLGHGAIVLPGAIVGRHCVVAAGSVVTGSLPDYSVAVGNPARVIRQWIDGEWRRMES
jgi:carbonic anhydrase/acetyltransferase-like protein (isoleucine patch superfamily)